MLRFIRAKRSQTVRCEDTDGPYAGVSSVFAPLDREKEARCLHVCLVCIYTEFLQAANQTYMTQD